jgi:hypothetical protein
MKEASWMIEKVYGNGPEGLLVYILVLASYMHLHRHASLKAFSAFIVLLMQSARKKARAVSLK